MTKAFSAGFLSHRPLGAAATGGVEATSYKQCRAACSVGQCPRARTARHDRAFNDSIAFVEQITV